MGERWRRRNHHPNDEDTGSLNPNHNSNRNPLNFHRPKGTENIAADSVRLGSHLVTTPGTNHITKTTPHTPFQRHNTHNRRWNHFYHGQSSAPSYNQNKRFKQYLLRMISETQHQIALWFPDMEDFESSNTSDSEMDWQPEPEFIIPQPGGPIMYPLSTSPQSKLNTSNGLVGSTFSHIPRKTFQPRDLGGFWGQSSGGDGETAQWYSMGVGTQPGTSISGQPFAEWRESPVLDSGTFRRSRRASEGSAVPLPSTRYRVSSGQAVAPLVKDWVMNDESSRGVLYDGTN